MSCKDQRCNSTAYETKDTLPKPEDYLYIDDLRLVRALSSSDSVQALHSHSHNMPPASDR